MLKTLEQNIRKLYGDDPAVLQYQYARYEKLYELYHDTFSSAEELYIISTPGRTEISGNHTDHNGGKVIAASINLDTLILFSAGGSKVSIKSDTYETPFEVDVNDLAVKDNEKGTTNSLIRGILARFKEEDYNIGGFQAVLTSNVMEGSGLSSSASVEIAIGSILNFLYNNNKIAPERIAKIGQYAENKYFGKPCGLMDQLACAIGGIIAIDFEDELSPKIRRIDFDLEKFDYKLLVVDSGATHENLTEDYAAITEEMKIVANLFNKKKCVELSIDMLLENWTMLRKSVSDRALLRTWHFLEENKRVEKQVNFLENNDLENFLKLVEESGNSSFKYLQNVFSVRNFSEQSLSLALAVSEDFIEKIGEGACRVHGGGFAGTIQVFLPFKYVEKYTELLGKLFGDKSLNLLNIRAFGPFAFKIEKRELVKKEAGIDEIVSK